MTVKTSYQPGEPTWVDLGTPDMDASIAFYGALFGWGIERGGAEFGGYSMFTRDGKNLCGIGPLMMEGQPPSWSTYLAVEDAAKTAELVTANGGQVFVPSMEIPGAGTMAVFADPTGAAISVWQSQGHIGSEITDDEGTFTWTELATRDQPAAHAFYKEVFGLDAHVAEGYTELQLAGKSVAGCMDMPEMVPAEVPSYWMPYFAASDPAAKAEQAASLGGTVLVPFMEFPGGTFSVVQDPQGATFGLLNLTPA